MRWDARLISPFRPRFSGSRRDHRPAGLAAPTVAGGQSEYVIRRVHDGPIAAFLAPVLRSAGAGARGPATSTERRILEHDLAADQASAGPDPRRSGRRRAAKRSRSTTHRSASLPTSIDPVSSSRWLTQADPSVNARIDSSSVSRSSGMRTPARAPRRGRGPIDRDLHLDERLRRADAPIRAHRESRTRRGGATRTDTASRRARARGRGSSARPSAARGTPRAAGHCRRPRGRRTAAGRADGSPGCGRCAGGCRSARSPRGPRPRRQGNRGRRDRRSRGNGLGARRRRGGRPRRRGSPAR